MRTTLLISTLALIPSALFAAGTNDATPPTPTETTTVCTDGTVWNGELEKCVTAEDASLNDDLRYDAAREFAYADQHHNAQRVLAAMSNPQDDRVLTYMGFTSRKLGRTELAEAYYQQALSVNPNNVLARSYWGQGLVTQGKMIAARAQLSEIRARGGRGTWAELSLRLAIENGSGYSY